MITHPSRADCLYICVCTSIVSNKIKKYKKYHIVETVPKSVARNK